MNKKIILTVISIIYLIILFIGAFAVNLGSEGSAPGSDKSLHFIGFFILSLLLIFTFKNYTAKRVYLKSLLIAVVIGILIEIIQLFIPARSFSLLDLAADLGGIFLAMLFSWMLSKR
jgi:VanZ family protein